MGLALVFLLACSLCVTAADASPLLSPYRPPHGSGIDAKIVVVDGPVQKDLALAEIERLPMVELVTRTVTDRKPTAFQGVLFSDLLTMLGMEAAGSVTVRAEDDYSAVIPRADWTDHALVFATRVDGRPLETRQFGPARLVYPIDADPVLDDQLHQNRAVWMIRSLER